MDDNELKRGHVFIPNDCLDKTTDYHTGLESSIVKMLAKLLVFSAFSCKELKDVSNTKPSECTKLCVDDFDTIMRWERSKTQVHSLQIDCIMTCINDSDVSTLDEEGIIIRAPSIFIHSKSSNYKYIYKLLEKITTLLAESCSKYLENLVKYDNAIKTFDFETIKSLNDESDSTLYDILCICNDKKLTRVVCEIIYASIITKRVHVTNVEDYKKPLDYIL